MDPQSDDFIFGKLVTEIGHLATVVNELSAMVKTLAHEVEEIKLFRAKVVGMSIGASVVVSLLFHVAESIWAK